MRSTKVKIAISLCLFIALFCVSSFMHPFYLGVTDLKYNAIEKSIQGSVKLFTNDFEKALKKSNKQPVDLINTKDKEATKKIISDYISKHFTLKLNGTLKSFNVVGFEQEEESIFTYIEFKNCETPKTIDIENTLLYDSHKEQANIVHFELNGAKKSVKVINPDKKIVFNY
jgi:hypothetical protein